MNVNDLKTTFIISKKISHQIHFMQKARVIL